MMRRIGLFRTIAGAGYLYLELLPGLYCLLNTKPWKEVGFGGQLFQIQKKLGLVFVFSCFRRLTVSSYDVMIKNNSTLTSHFAFRSSLSLRFSRNLEEA